MRIKLFVCLLAVAMPAFALAGTNHVITLDVQSGPANGAPGYVDTTGSNNQPYHYRYTGGVNDTGDVTINSAEGPNVPVVINLQGGYTIGDVQFSNDQNHQLGKTITNPKNAVIMDKNDARQAAYYMVVVQDGDATINCDPGIVNN